MCAKELREMGGRQKGGKVLTRADGKMRWLFAQMEKTAEARAGVDAGRVGAVYFWAD